MNAKMTVAGAAVAALCLAATAWAHGPEGGRGPGCSPREGREMRGGPERGGRMFFAPGEDEGVMAARRECRELARKARESESDEEREALKEQLREKVRAETERIDKLQEKRLDAIAEAAQKRIEALRAQLAEMKEHREEFVEEEVERLMKGPRKGEGPCGGMPPPPMEGEGPGEGMEDGGMPPPPPCGEMRGRGPRPPFREGGRPEWRHGPKGHRHGPGTGSEGDGDDGPEGVPEEIPVGDRPE